MSPETALQAAQFYLERIQEIEQPVISFYGGEPSLQERLIRLVLDHVSRQCTRRLHYALTTNGYRLDDDFLRMLVAHRFAVTVSLDGPAEVHDRYRRTRSGGPTFGAAYHTLRRLCDFDCDYFAQDVAVAVTVAAPDKLAEIRQFCEEDPLIARLNSLRVTFVSTSTNTFGMSVCMPESIAKEGEAMLARFGREYRDNLIAGHPQQSRFLAALFERPLLALHKRHTFRGSREEMHANSMCLPGVRKLYVTAEGKFLPCERVDTSLQIGDVRRGFDLEKVQRIVARYCEESVASCAECPANRLCHACFALELSADGFYQPGKQRSCENIRRGLRTLLTSYCEVLESAPRAFDFAKDIELR